MGFVKLPNDLKDWEWFDDKETTHVYLWLLLSAAWSDRRFKGVDVKRGQLVTTYPEITEKCGVSTRQARTILNRLKSTGKVTVKITPKFSIITLLEYDANASGDSQSDSQATVKRQSNDSPSLYNTEIKNIRNPEISAPSARGGGFSELFEIFWSDYPKKTAKQSALKAFEKIKPDEELLNKMLSSLEQQKKSVQWTKDNGRYIPYPANWLNGRRWEDELTEVKPISKFDDNYGMPKTEAEWLEGFE